MAREWPKTWRRDPNFRRAEEEKEKETTHARGQGARASAKDRGVQKRGACEPSFDPITGLLEERHHPNNNSTNLRPGKRRLRRGLSKSGSDKRRQRLRKGVDNTQKEASVRAVAAVWEESVCFFLYPRNSKRTLDFVSVLFALSELYIFSKVLSSTPPLFLGAKEVKGKHRLPFCAKERTQELVSLC